MPTDEQHVALPKLYGAPAYARPPTPASKPSRPFDPDDLPLEVEQTVEERDFAASLPARSYVTSLSQNGGAASNGDAHHGLRPRPLSLRAIAGKLIKND
ncbi:MAG: hypothetical protein ACJ761_09820 [Chloroflexota bacterium]